MLMMTIRELLAQGSESLRETSESPLLDAEVLLMHVLGFDRLSLIRNNQEEVCQESVNKFLQFIERRKSNEPVAYIVGHKEFWGLDFKVTPAVLIPRPDTEILLEEALMAAESIKGPLRILDLGTGSGAIAIAMATELRKKARDFSIVAVDKSRAALDLAAENAATLDAIEKIRFVESDWYAALPKGSKFNLIISNPPYIKEGDQNVSISTKFEPNSALYAGVDGLKDIKIIIQGLSEYLEPTGSFLCEIGSDQEDLIRNLVLEISPDLIKSIKFIKDLAGRSRVLSIKRGTEPN